MKKVLAIVGIAVLMSSVAAANVNPSADSVSGKVNDPGTRTNGTLGSLTITGQQIGSLEVQVDSSVTTQGGDGIPFYGTTTGGSPVTLQDQVMLYAQIYDSPWVDGCTFWDTPGVNWCAFGVEYFINSPTPLGNFDVSFTTTVPAAQNYQLFAIAYAGQTWPTTAFNWGILTQNPGTVIGPVGTMYVDETQPPTPTIDPNAGGAPIPTMNAYGIFAMAALLLGVAVLVIIRRK
ncbi:MAG: hypothetical protein ABFS37_12545 [Acidobacteriota bacterium]